MTIGQSKITPDPLWRPTVLACDNGSARLGVSVSIHTDLQPQCESRDLARPWVELRLARRAALTLAAAEDGRLSLLGTNAVGASDWACGHSPDPGRSAPAAPALDEVAARIEAEGRTASGQGGDESRCDADRIAARAVEEYLAWAFIRSYPLPLWLVPDMPAAEIHEWVLGRVGLGQPGLYGPGISGERFPYDVADRIDEILGRVPKPRATRQDR